MATVPRETWTDERLDDLKEGMHHEFGLVRGEMAQRFDEVDRRFGEVDRHFEEVYRRFGEVDRRIDGVEDRLGRIESRLEALSDRFDGLNRTLIAGAFAIVAAIIATGIF